MTPGYRDFEFDLPEALLARLITVLDGIPTAPLERKSLQHIPEEQGGYQLFLDRGRFLTLSAGRSSRYVHYVQGSRALQMRIAHRHWRSRTPCRGGDFLDIACTYSVGHRHEGVRKRPLDNQTQPVYIGKTDAKAGLHSRLSRHERKIQHRPALNPQRVSFKAVRIYVFTAIDLETQLIAHYGGVKKVQWNHSGFGSNDPGRERETTKYKRDHFDMKYQINIDQHLALRLPSSGTAARILTALKGALPYVFRFETVTPQSRRPHSELESTSVVLPAHPFVTARSVIREVVRQLPAGWQATQLPSHIILYKETRTYPQGTKIISS